jgi:magnesium transporter
MRLLTSLNMIILFPTFITSMFGMNLINGMENWKMGFPIAIIACVVSTAVSLLWFRRKKWL